MRRRHLLLVLLLVAACDGAPPPREGGPPAGWPATGGTPGGLRYSALKEIRKSNVRHLEVAWEFHTGDRRDGPERAQLEGKNHAFEATPILLGDALYFCTPRSRVISLDAETGVQRWRYDPEIDLFAGRYNFNCRGVAAWTDAAAPPGASCRERIYVATADARLVSLDASDGRPCGDFAEAGAFDLTRDVQNARSRQEIGMSSPPVVVGDVVVVGSAIRENARVDMPSGKVHAVDARSGALRWTWDPIPRDPADPARATWEEGSADIVGAANVWSLSSVDPERDLVFVPTSSPSPDFYGGERLGDNRHADSVVALRGSSGELVWAFQTVHHNLWDYDLASQPVLFDFEVAGRKVPAVAQATKMGHLFILHRETGEPLIPVEERPVPASTVPGERASPTQPFPTWPPPLAPQGLTPDVAWGLSPIDAAWCRDEIASLRSEGVFTPPSLEGTVIFPGTAGGSNWGSVAIDPERGLLIANTSSIANTIRLLPRDEAAPSGDGVPHSVVFAMEGTPFAGRFGVLVSPLGIPCNAPPWGALAALDLRARSQRWKVPLGTTRDLAPVPIAIPWGTPNMGGPIVTAGGLVFIGAALDNYLRAFDLDTGEELWKGRLPAGGQATPMTYRVRRDGRQFVVIAAGGHSQMTSSAGDSLMAFALPE